MRGIVAGLITAVAAVGLLTAVAFAQPEKARKFKAELITMFDDCPVTDGTTTGAPLFLDACGATNTDPLCGFTAGVGSGTAQLQLRGGPDIKFKAKLKGLTAGCEGETLELVARLKISTNNCVGAGRCTAETLDLSSASCTVTDGKCTISTTANTVTPGAIVAGDVLEMHVSRVFVRRTTGALAPAESFEAGLFVP